MTADKRFAVVAVSTGLAVFFLNAWLLMLVMGGLHHEVSGDIPAISYAGALLLSLAANLLVGGVRAARHADSR